ncbi:MAG TPA: hypothetical protein VMC86_10705 [Gemmatimonadales bacterium]|nr:hypothetical protein [Gemmatimonadales bacterium]
MKGTALALAAVLTFGTSWAGLNAMAAERATATEQGSILARALATPGPADQVWYGGTLPAITVEAPAYSAVVMTPTPPLTPPTRKA